MASSRPTDLYATLGVARDADEEAIRKAYRTLARELHPDVNPDPAAEERFKSVSEAYSTLSDADKRRAYDEFGEISLQPGFDAAEARRARDAFGGGFGGHSDFGGRGFGFGGLDDLVSDLFGRRGDPRSMRRRGTNLEADGKDSAVAEALESVLGRGVEDLPCLLRRDGLRLTAPDPEFRGLDLTDGVALADVPIDEVVEEA